MTRRLATRERGGGGRGRRDSVRNETQAGKGMPDSRPACSGSPPPNHRRQKGSHRSAQPRRRRPCPRQPVRSARCNPSPSSQAQSTTGRASNRPPFRSGLLGAARTGHAELTSGRLVARRRASCPRPGAAGQHVTRQRLPPGRGVQGRTGADGTFGTCPTCLEPSGDPSGRGLVRCARRDQEASGMPGAYPVDLRRRVVAAVRPMRQDSRRAAEPAALRRPAYTSPPPVARIRNSPPGIRFRDPGKAGRLQAAFKVSGNGSEKGREPLSGSPPGSCRRAARVSARERRCRARATRPVPARGSRCRARSGSRQAGSGRRRACAAAA